MTMRFPALTASGRLRRPVNRIIAIRAGANPSFDYFLAPRLASSTIPFEIRELDHPPDRAPAARLWDGALLLFCRYLTSAWLDAVDRYANDIAGVALFLDDDMDALFADWRVPAWYRARLFRFHLRYRWRLRGRLDCLLLSNPQIASRHEVDRPQLLSPLPGADDEPIALAARLRRRVAFHSTSVHRREHRWLQPVLEAALTQDTEFEADVTAAWPLRPLWRGLPRTQIAIPLGWPAFRTETAQRGADLLLAPLLPAPANTARAATKRIDAMRLGAALLVNDASVYKPIGEEFALGMCVSCEPELWSRAIVKLTRDPGRLARLRDINRTTVLEWLQGPYEFVFETPSASKAGAVP